MTEQLSIVLSGINGYGAVYLRALLDEPLPVPARIAALVDPSPGGCERLPDLESRGIDCHASLEECFEALERAGESADLTIISSPIHRHAPQTCLALQHGSHVLCEKPAAATVEEVDRMRRAQVEAGKCVAVGFQWSFYPSVLRLKADIASGLFGAPRRLKSLCFWPRDAAYYGRNSWAGRLRALDDSPVLDSPVNNAMAHFVHNLLYLLGDGPGNSARPASLQAELYRANAIETFDTAALRVQTDRGVEILFFGSHAVPVDHGPVFLLEFDEATVVYEGGASSVTAHLPDGTTRTYGSPEAEPEFTKLRTCLEAIAGERGQDEIPCGLDAARSHTLCVQAAHDSMPEAAEFPADLIRERGDGPDRLTWVDGLVETFETCYEENRLPGELGAAWARPGAVVEIDNQ